MPNHQLQPITDENPRGLLAGEKKYTEFDDLKY